MTRPRAVTDLGNPPSFIDRVFPDRTATIVRYAELLATTGVGHGLVGPREVPRIWERHVLNCGVVTGLVPDRACVADVGSGAGLPGLVWAIARPDVEMHLVEPLLRRTRWLASTIETLELDNVTVHRGKADVFAGELEVDVVTARAVARFDELARWCLPLLRPRGCMLAMKGSAAAEELDEARAVIRELGAVEAEVVEAGVGLVDPPTRVIRVQLGERRPTAARQRRVSRPGRRGGRTPSGR